MNKKIIKYVLFCVWVGVVFSGMGFADSSALKEYIKIGLKNNLLLKQQQMSLQKSLQVLREAKGMFLPSISIESRYSRAGGGRVIEMPIGDLVNPTHLALNQLLMMNGLEPAFPGDIPNEVIPFLREQEHETKLRVVQPVFQPGIYYNLKIKKSMNSIEKGKMHVLKRQLVEDIKTAFYNYAKSLKIKELILNTKELLKENLALNKSLFKNHKRTEEVVFRAKAELSNLEQQLEVAQKNCRMSASYFNFLLDRPLDTGIQPMKIKGKKDKPDFREYQLESLVTQALKSRKEFFQLQKAINATESTIGLHKSKWFPTVTAVFDYGFQGETYRFSKEDDYWMGNLVFSWNLYNGGQDIARKNQAVLQKKQLTFQERELENKIRLEVQEAYLDLMGAKKNITFMKDSLISRKETFSIVSTKYQQGMVPQIEFMKARNDFTTAEINFFVAVFDYYIKESHLERVSALYDLK
jgi:outer membrane protein